MGGARSSEEGSRTLCARALTAGQRSLLAARLRREHRDCLAHGDEPPLVSPRAALTLISVSAIVVTGVALRHFASGCGGRQAWPWVLAYVLALFPVAVVVVTTARARRAPRAAPRPGIYVTSRDVVVVGESALRVIPSATVVGVSERVAWLRDRVELTLWLTGEPALRLVVRRGDSDAVRSAVDRLRREVAESGYRGAASGEGDPLREIKASETFRDARDVPLASGHRLSLTIAAALAVLAALGVSGLRNRAGVETARVVAAYHLDLDRLRCLDSQGLRWVTDTVEREIVRDAVERGDYVEVRGELDHPELLDAELHALAIHRLYGLAGDDLGRLRVFAHEHPDAPEAREARARITALSLDEALTRDDVQAYAYVVRESPGTREAREASLRRSDRYARVMDALAARHGETEAVAVLREMVAYLEAHPLEEVQLRVDERLEGTRPSTELSHIVLRDRARAALAEILPRDVLPIVDGPPLPHRTPEEVRAQLAAAFSYTTPFQPLRLAKKEDDDSGHPEIRVVRVARSVRESRLDASRFEIELRTPTMGGETRRFTTTLETDQVPWSDEYRQNWANALDRDAVVLEAGLESALFAASG